MDRKLELDDRKAGESYSEYAYRVIRENIMNLNLLPGALLDEPEMADQLGVSRTPVHEAIRRLKEERLVDIIPRHASTVSYINMQLIIQGYFMRKCIEPEVVRSISGSISPEFYYRLRENLEKENKIIQSGSADYHFLEIDDEFHYLIYAAANKLVVYRSVKSVNSHFDRIRYLVSIKSSYDMQSIFHDHQEIMRIIMFGDTKNELNALFEHHLFGFNSYIARLEYEYPEYFTYGDRESADEQQKHIG